MLVLHRPWSVHVCSSNLPLQFIVNVEGKVKGEKPQKKVKYLDKKSRMAEPSKFGVIYIFDSFSLSVKCSEKILTSVKTLMFAL